MLTTIAHIMFIPSVVILALIAVAVFNVALGSHVATRRRKKNMRGNRRWNEMYGRNDKAVDCDY